MLQEDAYQVFHVVLKALATALDPVQLLMLKKVEMEDQDQNQSRPLRDIPT